jgi:hypothetical protein
MFTEGLNIAYTSESRHLEGLGNEGSPLAATYGASEKNALLFLS